MSQHGAGAWLEMRGIGKRYGAQTVLDRIDLSLGEHDFVCLLGASGCGKTTLLRILSGLESQHDGQILLQGQDITGHSPQQRRFGLVFQSYALFPNLTALDNVRYGLHGMSAPQAVARARDMLDLVGLSAHAGKYPAQLSGGQQQRVALARAVAPSPRLLLLDEPLSALDAQVRVFLREEIRRLQRQLRIPTVMVTHDQDEAMSMADRIVLMDAGRVLQDSAPVALYTRPVNTVAARFVGRMNVWKAVAASAHTVCVGNAMLQLASPATAQPGDAVSIGIRPEQVVLHEPDWLNERAPEPAPQPPNRVAAEVEEVVFCGAYIQLRLMAQPMGCAVEAEMSTPASGQWRWRVGDRVDVELPSHALRALESHA